MEEYSPKMFFFEFFFFKRLLFKRQKPTVGVKTDNCSHYVIMEIKNCEKKGRLHAELLARITMAQVSPTSLLTFSYLAFY